MKHMTHLATLVAVAMIVSVAGQALAYNKVQFQSISENSPLNPTPGFSVTNLCFDEPTVFGPIWYGPGDTGNEPGFLRLEMAMGYYSLLFFDNNGGVPFQQGVKYTNPTSWSYPVSGRPMMHITGLGGGYLSLYEDSYFEFQHLTLDLIDGSVESARILAVQHGRGWDPFYSDGYEVVLIDFNMPDEIEPESITALTASIIPEPTSSAIVAIGLCALWTCRRKLSRK